MGPAAQRLTKDNKDQCEREAVLRWNKRVDYSHKITLETPGCSTPGCGIPDGRPCIGCGRIVKPNDQALPQGGAKETHE